VGDFIRPAPYFAEVRAVGEQPDRTDVDAARWAVFLGPLKGTWSSSGFTVVNLERDPKEADPKKVEEREGPEARLFELAAGYRPASVDSAPGELSEATRKELEALGYLQ
jgi:hypothetical protein